MREEAGARAPSARGPLGLAEDPEADLVVHEGLVTGRLLYAAKGHLGTQQPAGGQQIGAQGCHAGIMALPRAAGVA